MPPWKSAQSHSYILKRSFDIVEPAALTAGWPVCPWAREPVAPLAGSKLRRSEARLARLPGRSSEAAKPGLPVSRLV